MASLVRPVFPELFASGSIIDAFTPDDKTQISTLMHAIEQFNVGIVLVIDNEMLQKEINEKLTEIGRQDSVIVLKVPKSQGIFTSRQSAEETERLLLTEYTNYFRGRHYQVFENNQQRRIELGLDEAKERNELDPQPINLPLNRIKIYEINGHTVDRSALPANSTAPEETTFPEEIRP